MKIRTNTVLIWIMPLLVQGIFSVAAYAETLDLNMEIENLEGAVVSDATLAQQSGSQGIDLLQIYDTEQNALLQDNWLKAGINGTNTIDGGSFSGATGFTSVIQNSGNNVIIQDTTLVNIMFN